ncbi:MAG: hypothetical protein AAF125_27610, partial [Chloroflexota bacterium]
PLLATTLWGVAGLARYTRGGQRDVMTIYWILTLPVVLRHTLHLSLYSPDNDLMTLLVGLVVLGLLLEWLTAPDDVPSGRLVTLALLVGVGVTYKLSFGVLGAAVALVALWRHWGISTRRWPPVVWGLVAGLALVVPWMARGVILSGYPLYPSTFGPFPVDWRMIPESAEQEAVWVRAWAREPGAQGVGIGEFNMPDISGWDWVVPWLFDTFTTTPNIFDVTLPVALTLIFLGVQATRRDTWQIGWLAMLPIGAALIFWWWVAPSPRFAGAAFWGAAAITGALVAAGTDPVARGRLHGAAVAVMAASFLLMPTQLRIAFPSGETVFYEVPDPPTREATTPYTTYTAPTETDQ